METESSLEYCTALMTNWRGRDAAGDLASEETVSVQQGYPHPFHETFRRRRDLISMTLHKEGAMKFMMTFTLSPATRNEAIARFLKTGGQPPKGVKLLG